MKKVLFWLVLGLSFQQAMASEDGLRHRGKAPTFSHELMVPLIRSNSEDIRIEIEKLPHAIESSEIVHRKGPYPPALDPVGMLNFQGNPDTLKLPWHVFRGVLLKYVDKRTVGILRRCNKSLYLHLTDHPLTADYFIRTFRERSGLKGYNYYEREAMTASSNLELWGYMRQLKAMQWFAYHRGFHIKSMLYRLEDYEWCPRVLFDFGYWRMKNKFLGSGWVGESSWGIKMVLATHGGDNLGAFLYFGVKTAVNVTLFAANIYYLSYSPKRVPQVCDRIFSFPPDSFVPSIEAQNTLFNWVSPYRSMTVTVPFMLLLMKDLYILGQGLNEPLAGKRDLLNLRQRWPLWKKEENREGGPGIEFPLVAFSLSFCYFFHPILMEWAIPMKGPFQQATVTVAEFTQTLTAQVTNSSWMQGCCMEVSSYVQPGCYVPWALDAAKGVVIYTVETIPSQGMARLVGAMPLIITAATWMLYFMAVRMVML